MVYLHDGEFDGFLTCIYNHYYSEKAEGIYESKIYEPTLLQEVKYITTDYNKADKVHKAIRNKFSEHMYFNIYHTFLSDDYEKDVLLLKYLKIAFKYGRDTERMRSVDDVYNIQKIARRVGFEKQRYLGLLRFSDLGEYLYARFEPDNNILTLLANHFVDRYKEEKFMIHDVKRKIAVVGYEGRWLLTDFDKVVADDLFDEEVFFRTLWKQYFSSISIDNRKNTKLQQSFVPLKCRKYLVEFNEDHL